MIQRTKSFEIRENQQSLEENSTSQLGQTIKRVQSKRQKNNSVKSINRKQVNTESMKDEPNVIKNDRKKIPQGLAESIKKRATGKKVCHQKKMQVSRYLLSKMRKVANDFLCEICQREYSQEEKSKLCDCPHEYCDSCLQHYTIYKVGLFEEVVCPEDKCDMLMNTEFDFYKNLPDEIKKKYTKIHAFSVTSKDPNLKICPSENCEGILVLNESQNPKCPVCRIVFCKKCFFQEHKGNCQKNQVDFFQNNLHYRQCDQCKNIIEKNQGCNHMTCRCGYQFCYICGNKWGGNDHLCLNIIRINNNNNNGNYCQCCQFGPLGIFGKIALFPLLFLLIILLTVKLIILAILLFILSIFVGMFPMAVELCGRAPFCWFAVIMVIFFPVVMLMGIVQSFVQFFCERLGYLSEMYCEDVNNVINCFCN